MPFFPPKFGGPFALASIASIQKGVSRGSFFGCLGLPLAAPRDTPLIARTLDRSGRFPTFSREWRQSSATRGRSGRRLSPEGTDGTRSPTYCGKSRPSHNAPKKGDKIPKHGYCTVTKLDNITLHNRNELKLKCFEVCMFKTL